MLNKMVHIASHLTDNHAILIMVLIAIAQQAKTVRLLIILVQLT